PAAAPAASVAAPEKKSPEPTRTVATAGVAGGEMAEAKEVDPQLDAPDPAPAPAGPTAFQSVSVTDMMAEIAAEESITPDTADLPELNEVSLKQAWNVFLERTAGSTLALHLKMAAPGLEEEEVVVRIGSQRVMASLRDDKSLIEHLRTTFQRPGLIMRLTVDENLKPAQAPVKKRLTAKDKFLRMREKNPAIDDLRKRFDLRPEE
ncbi:MAG: DNA polymerase III subunit gamma/tau, partial [Bacteroidota bacterium]